MLPNKMIIRKTSVMTVFIFMCVAAVVPGQVCFYVIIKANNEIQTV